MPKYDFMSFGEANIRLTPPEHDRLGQAEEVKLGIAAAELNCAVNISNLSVEHLLPTLKTAYVTRLVDNWMGKYIVSRAMMYGVDMSNCVVVDSDPIGKTRNGFNFIENGIGPRPSAQIYDRGYTALSKIQPGDIDWARILDTRWFHTTGIVTPLGEHTAEEVLKAIQAAKKNGATVSYDLNYRSTLWSRETARATMEQLMPWIDVVIGAEDEFDAMLNISSEPGDGSSAPFDLEHYRKAAEKVFEKYPNVKVVASPFRRMKSACLADWQTCMLTRDGFYQSRLIENLEIYDPVGSGDAFASAMIYGMLTGLQGQVLVDFAGAYSALCHTVRNDWNLTTRAEAMRLAAGGSAEVKR